jgi:DNA-binding NtrC family response regulator
MLPNRILVADDQSAVREALRLLLATNANMNSDVVSGRFRRNLFFRLNTVELPLPPLRERVEDIPLLARHFLAKHAIRYRKHLEGFEPRG